MSEQTTKDDALTLGSLVEAFRLSVKELRDAEDSLIADGGTENAARLLVAVDRYFVLRQALIEATKLTDALGASPS